MVSIVVRGLWWLLPLVLVTDLLLMVMLFFKVGVRVCFTVFTTGADVSLRGLFICLRVCNAVGSTGGHVSICRYFITYQRRW